MFTFVNNDKVRHSPTPIKPQRPVRSRVGDWADVVKFAIVAAVLTTSVILTGSPEAAVVVGSPLVALLRR